MIVTDEVRTYAIFNYEWMGWTTHTEAGGDTYFEKQPTVSNATEAGGDAYFEDSGEDFGQTAEPQLAALLEAVGKDLGAGFVRWLIDVTANAYTPIPHAQGPTPTHPL